VIAPLSKATRTIPIVMVQVIDPVGSGYVERMARPSGNITGFTQFEYSLAGKWLDLTDGDCAAYLTGCHPARADSQPWDRTVCRDPGNGARRWGRTYSDRSFQRCRHGAPETAFASAPNGGMIATVGGIATHRAAIIAAANKNRLPATYPYRYYAADGGLVSYGPDTVDQHRRAASYIDRILKGENPASLPNGPERSSFLALSRANRLSGGQSERGGPRIVRRAADRVAQSPAGARAVRGTFVQTRHTI
jgi:putative tryptophan/tyrosine transport system substrate-binding protein